MDDQQYDRLMEAVESGNAHLRSISIWVTIFGVIALSGVSIGFFVWVASVS